jgi:dihydropteroate synthase
MFDTTPTLDCLGRRLVFDRPRVVGIVNVTPDSFSGDGLALSPDAAVAHGLRLLEEGADALDVGGESTRPGSAAVSVEEELGRTIPVISALAKRAKVPVSVDTTKAGVARAALDAGATIVNDISAGRWDAAMLPLVAERGATFVAMHMQGTPEDMQRDPRYGDVVAEVLEFLRERGAACLGAGIARERIWIDPGIGFGKTLDHNLELLRRLPELRSLGLPVLVGVSRKAFIARIHGPAREDVARIGGTAAAVALAVQGGAEILRVHDVAVMAEAAAVARAVAGPPSA